MPLPSIGETGWGSVLNGQLSSDETTLALVNTNYTNHAMNVPADPHGDRSFASGLFQQVWTGVNEPNGLVQLNGSGKIPSTLIAGGGIISFYDAVNNFAVPTNGVADCSTAINNAISTCATNGGGIVWLGVAGVTNNTFCLAGPIVMQTGVYLWIAPNAILNRISVTGPPNAMITNYTSTSLYSGPFTITGGIWNVNNVRATGSVFIFANVQGVVFSNFEVNAYNDGLSPIGHVYGCTDVLIDNCSFYASGPPARVSCLQPCFRVEQCSSGNLSGIPYGQYTNFMCTDIKFRHCTNRAAITTDSQGPYTCWSSFCGTKGAVTSSSFFHQFIDLMGCVHPGLAIAFVEGYQWFYINLPDIAFAVAFDGTHYNLCPSPYVKTWKGSTPAQGGYWCGNISQNYLLP